MRIISGKHRGRKLECPPGDNVRPTSDMARSAVFNIIHNRVSWEDTKVLDLFCGTGALGIEAISRGATDVTFMDIANEPIEFTKRNLEKIHETAEVIRADASRLGEAKKQYNLVFIDPPYRTSLPDKTLEALVQNNWLEKDAYIVVEMHEYQEVKIPEGLETIADRHYGNSRILVLIFVN